MSGSSKKFKCNFKTFFPRGCILRPVLGCFALKTVVKICFFNVFHAKKNKKWKRAVCENVLLTMETFFLGIKHSTSVLVQTLKNCFSLQISCFFQLFSTKTNNEKAYFDQRLECPAPKLSQNIQHQGQVNFLHDGQSWAKMPFSFSQELARAEILN